MASKGICKIEKCEKEVRAKGYCDRHYRAWRKGKLPKKKRYKVCVEEKCRKPRVRQSLCVEHFEKKTKKEAAAAA